MVNSGPTSKGYAVTKAFSSGALHLSSIYGDSPDEFVDSDSVKMYYLTAPLHPLFEIKIGHLFSILHTFINANPFELETIVLSIHRT